MDEQIKYPWQQTIIDAFLSPPQETPARIKIAERTILARLTQSRNMDQGERAALEDAWRTLQVLISEAKSQRAEHSRDGKKEMARNSASDRADEAQS
jgi:hypothetical protein